MRTGISGCVRPPTSVDPAAAPRRHEEQRRVGLSVYAMRTGPLEGGLDWANLPTDKYGDRLYQLRPHRFGFAPRLAMAASCGADTLPEPSVASITMV